MAMSVRFGTTEEMRAWNVPAGALKDGENRIEIAMVEGKPAKVGFLDLSVR